MRPYLAVLKDSFREALASRVLWILLIVTTLILLAASPAGFKEVKTTRLKRQTVRNWARLAAKISDQAQTEGLSPGRQIWSRMSEPLKSRLAEAAEQTPGELSGEVVDLLVDEFNIMIGSPGLYDLAAWDAVTIGREAQQLIDQGAGVAAGGETARLNRLLLENAYPSEFRKGENVETYLVYLWHESGALPATQPELKQMVKGWLAFLVDYAIGLFGVFATILMTASIIPQMFEAGAIDLLLSKPVSRVLLFLTKFAGGCIFVGLIATYAIAGLWLIAGCRFGVWSNELILCIPVLLFLFAIYYGVSALVGVLWRNAIISVIVTVLFWAICFGVRSAKEAIGYYYIDPERLITLVPAGKSLLAVTEMGYVLEWSPRSSAWEEVFSSPEPRPSTGPVVIPQPLIGPVYDATRERIVTIPGPSLLDAARPGFNLFTPPAPLLIGKRSAAWNRGKAGTAPPGTLALFAAPGDQIVAVTKGAAFRLTRESKRAKGKSDEPQEKFVRSGPHPALGLDSSAAMGMHSESGALAIFNRGRLMILEPDAKGQYVRTNEEEIDGTKNTSAAGVAFGGKTILVALSDGRILIVDAPKLSVKHEFRPVGHKTPRFAVSAPGGRWLAVLFRNRKLWLYDAQQDRPASLSFGGQSDISAVAFDGPNQLLTADLGTRVTQYALDPYETGPRRAPVLTSLESSYHYGLAPLYTVLPKPGLLGNAIQYLLTDKGDEDSTTADLTRQQDEVDVAGPIWSSLAFLAVVLSLSCWYVWRSDF